MDFLYGNSDCGRNSRMQARTPEKLYMFYSNARMIELSSLLACCEWTYKREEAVSDAAMKMVIKKNQCFEVFKNVCKMLQSSWVH